MTPSNLENAVAPMTLQEQIARVKDLLGGYLIGQASLGRAEVPIEEIKHVQAGIEYAVSQSLPAAVPEDVVERAMLAFWNTWPSFREWWLTNGHKDISTMPPEPFENALAASGLLVSAEGWKPTRDQLRPFAARAASHFMDLSGDCPAETIIEGVLDTMLTTAPTPSPAGIGSAEKDALEEAYQEGHEAGMIEGRDDAIALDKDLFRKLSAWIFQKTGTRWADFPDGLSPSDLIDMLTAPLASPSKDGG
jgi:hypothetical protein